MIISASYKTDIPAFYGAWFMNRLNAGYCKITNPFNRKTQAVSLRPEDVDGFVFWTKNISPFIKNLEIIHTLRYPFMILHTITNYPRNLEPSVIAAKKSVENIEFISKIYGSSIAVWRYDPIIFTSSTDVDFHRKTFRKLAQDLDGYTNEVIISFAQIYKKTSRNLNRVAVISDFTWEDPKDDVKKNLVGEFADIANDHGMQLSICAQKKYVIDGTKAARCVDASRLSRIAEHTIVAKIKGRRSDCGCYQCMDIGEYDTCPHGCVYCYAVRDRLIAMDRHKNHDNRSEFLFDYRQSDDKSKQTTLYSE